MLPKLRIADWRPTKETLHRYAQIVGKVKLACAPPRNHWWHAALYVSVRGLTTGPLRREGTTFEIELDLVDHALVVRTLDGRTKSFPLGSSVAEFDARLRATLPVDVQIQGQPFGMPVKTPFAEDTEHAAWDRDAVERFHRVLDWVSGVLEELSGGFLGKQSPVQFFWQSLDLSLSRFSGRPGLSIENDAVNGGAYSHEVILFGFWNGDDAQGVPDAAFYSFIVPAPDGLRDMPLAAGEWTPGGLAILDYESVRAASDPRETLLAFFQSAYDAASGLAGWDA